MQIPTITGVIRRRLLINYRFDPDVIERLLPQQFQPKLHQGHAIAGLCLIRLEQIRPKRLPALIGLASENAAHRIAVTWPGADGSMREGVYIPRRDTGSRLNWIDGGRVFPGVHHLGRFDVRDDGRLVELDYRSTDGVEIHLAGEQSNGWPDRSIFSSIEESSRFFEAGSLGFSTTNNCCQLDGLKLATKSWRVDSFAVEAAHASWFEDRSIFPEGSVEFDHALIMRDIPHEWHSAGVMQVDWRTRELAGSHGFHSMTAVTGK